MNLFINIEAEQVILGSVIMNNQYLLRVRDILEEKNFYDPEHQKIYSKLIEVINTSRADEITLKDYFVNNIQGGTAYLSHLKLQASGAIDIRDYALEVLELYQKRQSVLILEKALEDLKDKNFNTVSGLIENELAGLAFHEPKKKTQTTEEILFEIENDTKPNNFISTGFEKLDELLGGGLPSQQMTIIGARPSTGKTSLCQNIIINAEKAKNKCLFISLEVDKRNVVAKFLTILSQVPAWKIKKGAMSNLEKADYEKAKQTLKTMKIPINDSSQLRVGQMGQIIKNYIAKNPLNLIAVDYVQIIKGEDTRNKNEASIIKEITSSLKTIAKQFDVAVLALAQINRKAVEGAKQEPTINDFKSSGGIEEDADICIILHRDRNEDRKESYFSSTGKLIIAKNRHGRTGEVGIKFDGETGIFIEFKPLF